MVIGQMRTNQDLAEALRADQPADDQANEVRASRPLDDTSGS